MLPNNRPGLAAIPRASARRPLLAARLAVGGLLLASLAAPAHAGWFESLFGKSDSTPSTAKVDNKARIWRLHEFTVIQLKPREAGSEANQHPVVVDPEALRQQLAVIQIRTSTGDREALFDTSELAELIPSLTQALARATPGDDILLLSSDRRGGGVLSAPKAVTARLFVQGGALQLIVHDARQDFYDAYRGTHTEPKFTFGSRAAAGAGVTLESLGASSRRADWLAIPMNVAGARKAAEVPAPIGAPVAPVAPAAIGAAVPGTPLPPAGVAAPVAAPAAVVPAPIAAPAVPTATAAPAAPALSEVERRLETLKRLHGKGLITDEEYQEKRKEILKSL